MPPTIATPRILGYLFGLAFLYGVWELRPAWITGALGLLVLYAVLTNVDRFAGLAGSVDSSLAGLIQPAPAAAGGKKRP